jgi:hypothetical protein
VLGAQWTHDPFADHALHSRTPNVAVTVTGMSVAASMGLVSPLLMFDGN